MKKIIILNKFDNNATYIDISTEKQRHKVSLFFIGKAIEEHFKSCEDDISSFGMTKEQIEAMPEGLAKALVVDAYDSYLYNKRQKESAVSTKLMLEKIIADQDGEKAWCVLNSRSIIEVRDMAIVDVEEDYPLNGVIPNNLKIYKRLSR